MCGIAGHVTPSGNGNPDGVERMLNCIRHRGPDDTGIWSGVHCTLGHARLSIIDLSQSGHQPLSNEDGTVWVAVNGEIYNYREIRSDLIKKGHRFRGHSDSEVLPHLYEEFGENFVNELRGMFAISLWDIKRRKLILARDRAGKKPLFYSESRSGLIFASEMKALLASPDIDPDINLQAIHDYLRFGAVPGEQTVYSSIHRVPPGHILVQEASAAPKISRYWSLDFLPKHKIGLSEARAETRRLLEEAVALRLRSDVPVGCFLSGGIDSGLITAIAAGQMRSPLKTYSIGFQDSAFDERPLAKAVSDRYATDHTEFVLDTDVVQDLEAIVGHFDEPFSDPSMLPSFAVARLAASDTKVVLNGDGADEMFAGYRHVIAARYIAKLRALGIDFARPIFRGFVANLPAPSAGRSNYQFLHRFLRVLASDDASRYLVLTSDRLDETEHDRLFGQRPYASAGRHISLPIEADTALGPVDTMMKRDFDYLLASEHLVKMDMATMAYALEARSPFLDHKLIEFVARLPEPYKQSGRTTKPLLRSLADELLPPEVASAPKRGFEIPLLRWLQGDLNPLLWERVTDPSSFASQYFDRTATEDLLRGRGWDAKRWANVAWMLLCLEIWWSTYRRNLSGRGYACAAE